MRKMVRVGSNGYLERVDWEPNPLIEEFLADLNKCNIYNYPRELDIIIKKWEARLKG